MSKSHENWPFANDQDRPAHEVSLCGLTDDAGRPWCPACRRDQAQALGRSVADRGRQSNGSAVARNENGRRQAATPTEEVFNAAELCEIELPDPRWAVGGMLPEGLSLLAGKPKLGKSWLGLNLAIAVACGGSALGQAVEPGDVLYLALEDTKRRLQNRLRKLCERQHTLVPHRLNLATSWPRQDKGGLMAVARWLDANGGARLVIIDTWAKFRPARFGNRNDYDTDYQHAAELKNLADAYNIAILAVHHCRKMEAADALDEVSGTLGLTGAADGVLVMRRARGQHDASLFITGRDVEERELALKWHPEHALWSVLGDAGEYRVSRERQEVLELLAKAGPLGPSEVAGRLGKNAGACKKLLWTMREDGQLQAGVKGKYMIPGNRGNPSNPAGNQSDNPKSDNEKGLTDAVTGAVTTVTEVTDGREAKPADEDSEVL